MTTSNDDESPQTPTAGESRDDDAAGTTAPHDAQSEGAALSADEIAEIPQRPEDTPAAPSPEVADAAATEAPGTEHTDPALHAAAPPPVASNSGSVATGALAVFSAGLGLASLMGTSLSDMMRSRQEVVGQIDAGMGGGGDQIEAAYGAPWDATAMANGMVALLAIAVGGVLSALLLGRATTPMWIKAVALAGVMLGVLGLAVAGGMYLDLFGSQPTMPQQPMPPGGGG